MNAITQALALASTRRAWTASTKRESSVNLLKQLSYDDLVQFAHEVGNALAVAGPEAPEHRAQLRHMYQRVADEHYSRLNNGRSLT